MSKFTNFFTRFAAVGAKLTISLSKDSFKQGETITGKLDITCGSNTQVIRGIQFLLLVYLGAADPIPITWCQMEMKEKMEIHSGDPKSIPFELPLPLDTPISNQLTFHHVLKVKCIFSTAKVRIQSKLLDIEPSPTLHLMMETVKEMGFSLFVITDARITYDKKVLLCQKFWYKVPDRYRKEWNEFNFIHLGNGSFLFNWRSKGFAGAMRYIIYVDRFQFKLSITQPNQGEELKSRLMNELDSRLKQIR